MYSPKKKLLEMIGPPEKLITRPKPSHVTRCLFVFTYVTNMITAAAVTVTLKA